MAVNNERETNNNNTDKTWEIMMSYQYDSSNVTISRVTIESDDETDTHAQNEEISKINNNVIIVGTKTSAEKNININPDITDTKSLKRTKALEPNEMVSIFWDNMDNEGIEDKTNTKNEDEKARESTEPRPKRRKSITPNTSDKRGQKFESFGVVNEIPKKTYLSHPKEISAEIETKNSDLKVTKSAIKHFPRTKVTSRREVKKFPGKMDSMRKHAEETIKIVKETKSAENNMNEIPIKLNKSANKTNMTTHDTVAKPHDSMIGQLQNENISKNTLSVSGTASVPKATDTNIAEKSHLENTFGPHLYKMLKNISETLLTLFPLIHNYVMATKTRPVNENDLKEASIKLNKSKIFCFSRMHSWIKTLILPFKGDSKYMEAFLVLTSRMAKKRRLECFSIENLKILCAEMIAMTENEIKSNKEFRMKQTMEWRNHHQQSTNQRCEADQFPQQHLSQIQNPTLTSMLAKGPTQFQSTKTSFTQTQKGQQNMNYLESSEQTAVQHANTLYRYNSESSNGHEYNAYHAIRNTQNQQNTYQNGMNNFSDSEYLELLANRKNSHGITNSNCAKSPYAGRPNELSVLRIETAQASDTNVTSLPVASQIQNPPWLNMNTSSVVPNLNQPAYPPPPYSAYVPEKNPCNPLRQQRRISSHQRSYSEIQIPQQGMQAYDPNRAGRAITPVQQRSLSRDSGIMTPTHEQMQWPDADSYAPSGEDAGASFCPMITHVTSMNPQADPNTKSTCSVCGTFTNLTCMQCSSIYYCTVQCQATDWSIHRLLCAKKT